jgi:DNA-binding response OmpR family regulator
MGSATILVVDDQPVNVQILRKRLERENLTVIAAHSGEAAIVAVRDHRPDLILLDVVMPELDGIEVCRRLQSVEENRSTPIIFITARDSKEGKIEGLGVGAVDYITRPIDLDETTARVLSHLRFATVNRQLVELQHRLAESRRAATIGAVTQGIAHNLNNLLGIVIGYLDLIQAQPDDPESVRRNANQVEHAVQRIVAIIKQLSSLAVSTHFPTSRRAFGPLVVGAIARFRADSPSTAIIDWEDTEPELAIDTHVEVFEDAVTKILMNALEAYEGLPDVPRTIRIRATRQNEAAKSKVILRIEDHGRGIDPEIRDQMFEPFVSSKQTVGVGMGLTVARHALRSLGGDVMLFNRDGGGAVAEIHHPIGPPLSST